MVNEISNRTLAILLVAAIAVSLAGTLLSLNMIAGIPGMGYITGFATNWTNATARVEIVSVTHINFSNATIDFGTGYISGGVNCTMNSSGNDAPPADTSCKEFHGSNGTLVISNIGNTEVYVNISFGKNSSNLFQGTHEGKGQAYRYIVGNDSADPGCHNLTASSGWSWADVPATPTTHVRICSNLTYVADKNELNVNLSITIPDDSALGVLSDEITATAETI